MTEQDKRAALNKYAADLAQYNQDIYMRTHGPAAEEYDGAWKAYEAIAAFEGDWCSLQRFVDNQYENYMFVLRFSDDEAHWGAFKAYEHISDYMAALDG